MTIFLKNNRGSLMIDLLVVLGIIALLTTITIPYLRKYQPILKLNAAARLLATDLRYAQQLTVTEQKVHVVKFDQALNQYDILKIDEATTTVKSIALDSEISFQQITGLTGDQVVFNYYGGVSQAGTIILTNAAGRTATINLKPSGYVQLEE